MSSRLLALSWLWSNQAIWCRRGLCWVWKRLRTLKLKFLGRGSRGLHQLPPLVTGEEGRSGSARGQSAGAPWPPMGEHSCSRRLPSQGHESSVIRWWFAVVAVAWLLCPVCPFAGGYPQQDRRRFESDLVGLLLTAVFGRRRQGRESLDLRFAPGPGEGVVRPWVRLPSLRNLASKDFVSRNGTENPHKVFIVKALEILTGMDFPSNWMNLEILDEHVGFCKKYRVAWKPYMGIHGHTSHHSLVFVRNHVVPHRVSCIYIITLMITKGSVSYLSSPCFSTIIGGIGGPARGKRRLLDVMY